MSDLDIVHGQTRYLDFQLQNDGANFNSSGMTITAVVVDQGGSGSALSICSTYVQWLWATCSQARVIPSSSWFDYTLQPYTLRFKVIDGNSRINYYPSTLPFTITVRSQ